MSDDFSPLWRDLLARICQVDDVTQPDDVTLFSFASDMTNPTPPLKLSLRILTSAEFLVRASCLLNCRWWAEIFAMDGYEAFITGCRLHVEGHTPAAFPSTRHADIMAKVLRATWDSRVAWALPDLRQMVLETADADEAEASVAEHIGLFRQR